MSFRERMSQVGLVVLICCAVATTGLTIRRELFARSGAASPAAAATSNVVVKDWAGYAASGHRLGPEGAPVTIVEFADFECPACRVFAVRTLAAIRASHPTDVAVVYRYWPLPYHHLAYPAARAAECASAQGRFESIHDAFYQKQDSLGVKSYEAFASESGVSDLVAFRKCMAVSTPVPVIESDMQSALAVGGHGTPTIIVNGLLLGAVPDSAALERVIRDALSKGTR